VYFSSEAFKSDGVDDWLLFRFNRESLCSLTARFRWKWFQIRA
jgi:hypothetical protein